MILDYLDHKRNTNTIILFKCDKCGIEYQRITKSYTNMKKNPLYDMDYCVKCWRKAINSSPDYKKNMSKAIRKMFNERPEIRQKISEELKKNRANIGDKNGMKQLKARQKVSAFRKKMFQDPKVRQHYSDKTREAWARGDFEGVHVGQCSWHNYEHSNGETYKVQGKWELEFIKWLDESNLHFKCHRGRIPYTLNGQSKNYYPDFWIDEWNCYVDVKCKYFYNEEKFQAIRDSNPDVDVKILFKPDLVKLGVKI